MASYTAAVGVAVTNSLGDIRATEVIASEVSLAAQAQLPWPRLIRMARHPGGSNVVQIPVAVALSLSNTDFTLNNATQDLSVAYNMNQRDVTLTGKGVDVVVHLDSFYLGAVDPRTFIVDSITKAYIKKIDTDVMALYTESPAANDIGSSGTAITYSDHFLPGFERLATNAAPPPYAWMLAATQISEFGADPQFAEFQKYGQSFLDQNVVMPQGYLGLSPLGVDIYWSNHYTSSSGNHGIMFARDAIVMVEALPWTMQAIDNEQFAGERAIKIGGTTIYGVSGTRGSSATDNEWICDIVS